MNKTGQRDSADRCIVTHNVDWSVVTHIADRSIVQIIQTNKNFKTQITKNLRRRKGILSANKNQCGLGRPLPPLLLIGPACIQHWLLEKYAIEVYSLVPSEKPKIMQNTLITVSVSVMFWCQVERIFQNTTFAPIPFMGPSRLSIIAPKFHLSSKPLGWNCALRRTGVCSVFLE